MRTLSFTRRRLARLAGLLLFSFVAVPAVAAPQQTPQQPGGQSAADFIQKLGTQAIQVAGPSVPAAQRTALYRRMLADHFDMEGAARFALGPYGRGLSPEQRQEFMRLFTDTVAQAYSDKLSQYAGDPFRVIGVRPMGGESVVMSEVLRRGGPPIRIDWHVADHGGRFLVTDVYVDGVSQRVTERTDFAGIIQRNGGRPDAVLAALRQNLAQSGAAGGHAGAAPGYGSSYPPATPNH